MNDINLLYLAVDAIAATLLTLLALRLGSQADKPQLIFLFAWISIGLICNIIAARQDYAPLIDPGFQIDLGSWYATFNLIRNSTAGAFMLVCHMVFGDRDRIPMPWLILWVIQVLLEEPVTWVLGTGWHPGLELVLYETVPALLQTAFLAVALYWILSSRDADLVKARRTARTLLVLIFSMQALLSLLFERIVFQFEWFPDESKYPLHVAVVVLTVLLNGILLLAAFSPNVALILGRRKKVLSLSENSAQFEQDKLDTDRIRDALEVEHIYRTPGLTVRGLSEHLGLPEYRLRNLVHEQLGFRNFNALLHHYRIQEVCEALEDPKQNSTPVLTLALTAGYQSINPFNRAFREELGLTPTQYRRTKQQHTDS